VRRCGVSIIESITCKSTWTLVCVFFLYSIASFHTFQSSIPQNITWIRNKKKTTRKKLFIRWYLSCITGTTFCCVVLYALLYPSRTAVFLAFSPSQYCFLFFFCSFSFVPYNAYNVFGRVYRMEWMTDR